MLVLSSYTAVLTRNNFEITLIRASYVDSDSSDPSIYLMDCLMILYPTEYLVLSSSFWKTLRKVVSRVGGRQQDYEVLLYTTAAVLPVFTQSGCMLIYMQTDRRLLFQCFLSDEPFHKRQPVTALEW